MKEYLYEIHCHTSETSRCACVTGAELARFYKRAGFRGICITDHFFNGNTTVASHLGWEERVEQFCLGYRHAKEEGGRIGLDVFFGFEYSFRGTDLLTYGPDPGWLASHSELLSLGVNEYCDLVHRDGGFIIHAHPFREAAYIEMIRLLPRKVDAVEVYNAGRTNFENKMAAEYAQNYGLSAAAGSDNHAGDIPVLAAMRTAAPQRDVRELMRSIVKGKAKIGIKHHVP